ncbi:hypothetical protein R6Q59_009254 [Mikania micrantha]
MMHKEDEWNPWVYFASNFELLWVAVMLERQLHSGQLLGSPNGNTGWVLMVVHDLDTNEMDTS